MVFTESRRVRRRLETAEFAVKSMELIEPPTPLLGDISVWLATYCKAFVHAVRELMRAELFDDTRETLHPRLDDDADVWVAHYVRLRFFASKSAR